jgi:hypothetical protein
MIYFAYNFFSFLLDQSLLAHACRVGYQIIYGTQGTRAPAEKWQFLYNFLCRKTCNIFTYSDRIARKLWPKHKIYVNLFFRLSWCGRHRPGQSTNFNSIRCSGGFYSFFFIVFKALMVSSFLLGMFLFCCRKRKENNYELRI